MTEQASTYTQGAGESVLPMGVAARNAAIGLAQRFQRLGRHGEAVALVLAWEDRLATTPYYLGKAGTICANAGLPDVALRLYRRADALQPGVDSLRARLAAACVHVGRTDEARAIYENLLEKYPDHQRNHYELSRLSTAKDRRHVDRMLRVLAATDRPPPGNIYLYYALGKELEDLGEWDEAFHYYRLAGDAARSVAQYDVRDDVRFIDAVIDTCSATWLQRRVARASAPKSPVFVVGLPRSGTTLVDRILSSHSQVDTAGESFFVPAAIRSLIGRPPGATLVPADVDAAANVEPSALAAAYLDAIDYRLGQAPLFVEKLPENLLYLGFLARAFPRSRLVLVRRKPMDVCFALYKQSFFRYAYSQDDLGRYYPAYHRLAEHWARVLGERLVTVDYELLVTEPELQVRGLLARLGLEWEPACLAFHENPAPTNTASAAQVREPVHTRSVGRWRRFAGHLEPLAATLRAAGIDVDA